jgi:phosphoadenosine phosphosulfate reductase
MALIKHGLLSENDWKFLADDEALPPAGPVVVSLERWQREQNELLARSAPLGIKLKAGEHPSAIAEHVSRFALIALEFPKFTDGRAYSYARLLRERYGYKGELRAIGQVLRDQLLFMHRCGFDAFEVAKGDAVEQWLKAIAEFDIVYQPAADGSDFAARRRHGRSIPKPPKSSALRMAPAPTVSAAPRRHVDPLRFADLARRYGALDGLELLRPLIGREFKGRIAVVSSFGAESVLVLDLVAAIDPATPVIFLDTGKHFPETLAYRDLLIARLGLRDVRSIGPSPLDLDAEDRDGSLWARDSDRCCELRKVTPLERALNGFDGWVTGRKRFQGDVRGTLDPLELVEGRIKINPLALWSAAEVATAIEQRELPRHPLLAHGYRSIGCAPCTVATNGEATVRAGRWPGADKTECGIHRAGFSATRLAEPANAA